MKNIGLIIILSLTSCTHNNYNDSTIKKQIIDITSDYNKIWETLDVEDISEFHSDENFVYYWHGEVAARSNEQFRKLFSTILSSTKEWSIKTSQPLVQVINEQAAIISFTFEAESIEMNGKQSKESGALTYIWNKFNDKWKIVHVHESAQTGF